MNMCMPYFLQDGKLLYFEIFAIFFLKEVFGGKKRVEVMSNKNNTDEFRTLCVRWLVKL